jgi:hypothetical protein
MDRYLVVNGKFKTHRYGAYVRHDEFMTAITKRDARIAELEAQLAACAAGPSMLLNCPFCDHIIGKINSCKCAAGPWRRIAAEDRTPDKAKLIMQFCSDYGFSDISTAYYAGMFDGKHNWSIEAEYISEGEDWMITTINPPEAASCAR